ncbi:transposase [Ralstonia solanacearum]|nr:transposase [Ralstonia solanacearum]
MGISRSLFHYESRRRIDDEVLTGRMVAIAAQKRRYGYRRIHVLLQREGWLANHKRIWRLYSKAGLSVRKRRRKRIAAVERKPPVPFASCSGWSAVSMPIDTCPLGQMTLPRLPRAKTSTGSARHRELHELQFAQGSKQKEFLT